MVYPKQPAKKVIVTCNNTMLVFVIFRLYVLFLFQNSIVFSSPLCFLKLCESVQLLNLPLLISKLNFFFLPRENWGIWRTPQSPSAWAQKLVAPTTVSHRREDTLPSNTCGTMDQEPHPYQKPDLIHPMTYLGGPESQRQGDLKQDKTNKHHDQ